jgi:hypothetical protein
MKLHRWIAWLLCGSFWNRRVGLSLGEIETSEESLKGIGGKTKHCFLGVWHLVAGWKSG